MKNLLDVSVSGIVYVVCGYAFEYGDDPGAWNGFIGTRQFFLDGVCDYAFVMISWAFLTTAGTIFTGCVLGRMRLHAYMFCSLFLAVFVYPAVGHWFWSPYGWLYNITANGPSPRVHAFVVRVLHRVRVAFPQHNTRFGFAVC